jgi:hypothetical protein
MPIGLLTLRGLLVALWLVALADAALAAGLGGCLSAVASTRLQLHCLLGEARDRSLSVSEALVIDHALRREGFAQGLGLPAPAPDPRLHWRLLPGLRWTGNANGGSPARPLSLGAYTLRPDPDRLARGDVLLGATLLGRGRALLGPGRVVDIDLGAIAERGLRHGDRAIHLFADLCGRQPLGGRWAAETCVEAAQSHRLILREGMGQASGRLMGLFRPAPGIYAEAGLALERRIENANGQTRLRADLVALAPTAGLGTSHAPRWVRLMLATGAQKPDTLLMAQEAEVAAGASLGGRPAALSLGWRSDRGGLILGHRHEVQTLRLAVEYQPNPRFRVILAHQITQGRIDYFDDQVTSLQLQLTRW